MGNLLENLKRYFETTPREEVLEDWEKTKAYDAVGITVSELLCSWYEFTLPKCNGKENKRISNVYYPKNSSGFFMKNI